ncbi:MAG: M4 family metallopeptidase [Myxococcota bacterium]
MTELDHVRSALAMAQTKQSQAKGLTLPNSGKTTPTRPAVGPLDTSNAMAQAAIRASFEYLRHEGFTPQDFRVDQVIYDDLGMVHVRLDRQVVLRVEGQDKILPILGEQVIAHIDDGMVNVTGDLRKLSPERLEHFASIPSDKNAAYQVALAAMASEKKAPPILAEKAQIEEIIFYNEQDDNYYVGYQVILTDVSDPADPQSMVYLIDGENGEVIQQWNAMHSYVPPEILRQAVEQARSGNEVPRTRPADLLPRQGLLGADDRSMYSGMVDLSTSERNGEYVLFDATRGQGISTLNAQEKEVPAAQAAQFVDSNNIWGEPRDPSTNMAAVDAHYGAQATYDAHKEVLGRNSIDGRGGSVDLLVHFGKQWPNASFDGVSMKFGDGDGRVLGSLAEIGVAAHELTHGVTHHTAKLIYRGQSGGLNESMSDTLGEVLVTFHARKKNPDVKFNWMIGENVFTPGTSGDAMRYLDQPTRDGRSIDHISQFKNSTDVHHSSGLPNHVFYQIAETDVANKKRNSVSGKRVEDGIGVEATAKIFYRALNVYMTPKTTFFDARKATIQAAADLHGGMNSREAKIVAAAWDVVGVDREIQPPRPPTRPRRRPPTRPPEPQCRPRRFPWPWPRRCRIS